jgi:hypothetical protein
LSSEYFVLNVFRTGILRGVLYRCNIWSHILREEHRWRVFEDRLMKRINGPRKDEVTGGWKKISAPWSGRFTPRKETPVSTP